MTRSTKEKFNRACADAGVLDDVDAIIFDCDGVLIDVTGSYDATILQTAKFVLRNMANISDVIDIDSEIINGFKSAGGFNHEVDLTYAAIISIVAADNMNVNQTDFIYDVIKHADSAGITSVERYIESFVDISDIKKMLAYPSNHDDSPLYQTFDHIFYGHRLYQEIYGTTPSISSKQSEGLIERDDVLLTDSLVDLLKKRFGSKMALVTGRGFKPAYHSLGPLLKRFDLKNSAFLEDLPRKLAKPNPHSLLSAIRGMNSAAALYVGDSMEDCIMVKRANNILEGSAVFCGIVGTSKSPKEKTEMFRRKGAAMILDSIDQIPKVLNLEG